LTGKGAGMLCNRFGIWVPAVFCLRPALLLYSSTPYLWSSKVNRPTREATDSFPRKAGYSAFRGIHHQQEHDDDLVPGIIHNPSNQSTVPQRSTKFARSAVISTIECVIPCQVRLLVHLSPQGILVSLCQSLPST